MPSPSSSPRPSTPSLMPSLSASSSYQFFFPSPSTSSVTPLLFAASVSAIPSSVRTHACVVPVPRSPLHGAHSPFVRSHAGVLPKHWPTLVDEHCVQNPLNGADVLHAGLVVSLHALGLPDARSPSQGCGSATQVPF